MNKILHAAVQMAQYCVLKNSPRVIDTIVLAKCSSCGNDCIVTIGALYKQYKRGNHKYLCRSCSGVRSWTNDKRLKASAKSKKLWNDPEYAGTIDGKAIANDIKRIIDE